MITTLADDFEKLRALHDECIELINQGKVDEAQAILYGEAYPVYQEADDIIAQVLDVYKRQGLYDADKLCQVKRSEENPVMMSLYSGILKNKVHELLHVNYTKGEGTKS